MIEKDDEWHAEMKQSIDRFYTKLDENKDLIDESDDFVKNLLYEGRNIFRQYEIGLLQHNNFVMRNECKEIKELYNKN
ncbi:MAG: hypothetical protein ABIB43_06955 [archaeon]